MEWHEDRIFYDVIKNQVSAKDCLEAVKGGECLKVHVDNNHALAHLSVLKLPRLELYIEMQYHMHGRKRFLIDFQTANKLVLDTATLSVDDLSKDLIMPFPSFSIIFEKGFFIQGFEICYIRALEFEGEVKIMYKCSDFIEFEKIKSAKETLAKTFFAAMKMWNDRPELQIAAKVRFKRRKHGMFKGCTDFIRRINYDIFKPIYQNAGISTGTGTPQIPHIRSASMRVLKAERFKRNPDGSPKVITVPSYIVHREEFEKNLAV